MIERLSTAHQLSTLLGNHIVIACVMRIVFVAHRFEFDMLYG